MNEPQFKAAYDAVEEEFALFAELVRAREVAGVTQEEVAQRMGTKTLPHIGFEVFNTETQRYIELPY